MTTATLSTTPVPHASPPLIPDDEWEVAEAVGWTAVDLATRFGPIPLHRICGNPTPGTGTEEDVLAWEARSNRLFELYDGVLVEKTMSSFESFLAVRICVLLSNFITPRKLGIVLGADGMLQLVPGMIRIPDASFIAMNKLPGKFSVQEPIASLVPDLAVEVLSRGNTREEMEGKLDEYFEVGVREVWYVDPRLKRVRVYETRTNLRELTEADTLESRVALPGFSLSLKELFADPVSG